MTTYRLADEVREIPMPVLELYLACKSIEDSDGSWSGGDVVEIVTELLSRHGLDVDAPVSRFIVPTRELEAPMQIRAKTNDDLLTVLENEADGSLD